MFVTFLAVNFKFLVTFVQQKKHIFKIPNIVLFHIDKHKDSLLFRISEPWQIIERFAGEDTFPLARLFHRILTGLPFLQDPRLDSEDNVASSPDQSHPVRDDLRVEVGGDAHTGDQIEGGSGDRQWFVEVGLLHFFVNFLILGPLPLILRTPYLS